MVCVAKRVKVWRLILAIANAYALVLGIRLGAAEVFVIEAEDFNFGGGRFLPQANRMPYLGGAYQGFGAVPEIDYHVISSSLGSDIYRIGETPNVGITESPDTSRGSWAVQVNYRLQWLSPGCWFNYTRYFSPGYYWVYAALSHISTANHMLMGILHEVTSGANSTNQVVVSLGRFDGAGTGEWGKNRLVPLVNENGEQVVLFLSGLHTLRYEALRGDLDYIKLVPVPPPEIVTGPLDQTVEENQPVEFRIEVQYGQLASYQWQSNRVDIPGATNPVYRIEWTPMAANGTLYRCVVSNAIGTAVSREARLTVLPDRTPPRLVRAVADGPTRLRVEFSEPVDPATALNATNYTIVGNVRIVSVLPSSVPTTVLLVTTPLTLWTPYRLQVRGILDCATQPNMLQGVAEQLFVRMDYQAADIGGGVEIGQSEPLSWGYIERAAGQGIAGSSDQFHFNYRQVTGDFDFMVRVAKIEADMPYAQAGLMARTELTEASPFVAVLASPGGIGVRFASRLSYSGATIYGNQVMANYPYTWLRLKRSGDLFRGYVSYDGTRWFELGSVTLSAPQTVYLGHAVSSKQVGRPCFAVFLEPQPVSQAVTIDRLPIDREPLAPSSRRTRVVISEIMYHPPARSDGRDLEFIELANPDSIFEEIGGWEICGDIHYVFPPGTILPAGGFIIVAKNPEDFRAVYGLTNVFGPYEGRLNNAGSTVQLRNHIGATLLSVQFTDRDPWPAAADGAGHSLVLCRPSYGEADPRAWRASRLIGGSPGYDDPFVPNPWEGVVINELLAHTDLPQVDFIELFNRSATPVDISGCYLTDDPNQLRFRIPDGTVIPPGGFAVFDETQLGFALDAAGEAVFLIAADKSRVLDAYRFDAQANGRSLGRYPDGADEWSVLARPTPGDHNTAPWQAPIVINEIMYDPISGDPDDEYVELYNRSGQLVDLSGWRFVDGIDYEFPPGARLGPGEYLVVARNVERLLSRYPQLNSRNTFGPYKGSLSDTGERIALAQPDLIVVTNRTGEVKTNTIYTLVNEVRYNRGWGRWSSGGGSSLELIDPHADNRRAYNWADSDESQKAPWTDISVTGRLDLGAGFSPDRLFILLLGPGECLIDDVEVRRAGSASNLVTNGGFEQGDTGWSFFGNHKRSYVQTGGAASGSKCLHVVADGDGDTGPNSIRTALASGLNSGSTAIIRAKARWLAGWPQVLLRLHGNWLELAGQMKIPDNLGTPGLPNSRLVSNAGPAIWDVRHDPVLPQAGEQVRVTARVEDPDGVALVSLQYRFDGQQTPTTIVMRDDGLDGDERAGDGLYTALIPGQNRGTLIAFNIQAKDRRGAGSTFPRNYPAGEALIRWGDPVPNGDFTHYHIWATRETLQDLNGSNGLDNSWRDMTLVYRNCRVIYNAKFRHKGSPYHGGRGDYAVTVPRDDLLLGTDDRVFASTGNGGSEGTAMRGQLANWMASELGIPFLHSKYMLLYINGAQFRNVVEDLEQPNRYYAERWCPEWPEGDLYKVAVWFEFQDNNSSFNSVGATLEEFKTTGGAYKEARYRWNFQLRPKDRNANWHEPIYELAARANSTDPGWVKRLNQIADMEEWMRVLGWNRVTGNWDSWGFRVGQNMFIYTTAGQRAVLFPWDIDFVFGLGDGPTSALWGGQDPVLNRLFETPAFQRALWRTYIDAVRGPMLPQRYQPQIEARSFALRENQISGLESPSQIGSYIDQRRAYLQTQIEANNVPQLRILSGQGGQLTTRDQVVTLEGEAPLECAFLAVNGVRTEADWLSLTRFRIQVPLTETTNRIVLTGLDRFGRPIPGVVDSITVYYEGEIEQPEKFLVINEIYYNPRHGEAAFVEIYNRSERTTFDLSGWRLNGVGFRFPDGVRLGPQSYVLVVSDRALFEAQYGKDLPVVGEFRGNLDKGGETISLLRPGAEPDEWIVVDEVRYDDDPPWPSEADGYGSSLQLIDPSVDNWRVGNWAVSPTNSMGRVTPGALNSTYRKLEEFPPLWLNEIQTSSGHGFRDRAGDPDPWVEIYNSGDSAIDLGGLFLSDRVDKLDQWEFPSGTILPPKSFLIVWLDGEPGESCPGELHTSFRVDGQSGIILLSRRQANGLGVIDYLRFDFLSPARSYGSYPDGQGKSRRSFDFPTPGLPNNPASRPVKVFINEWMAANRGLIVDPADGDFDDWFELFNAGPEPVDLADYYLSDNPADLMKFKIPAGFVIQPGGFLVVWADGEPGQTVPGQSLHVNFRLDRDGDTICLTAPDGTLVDKVSFGPQLENRSEGRDPDGAGEPFALFEQPTPGAPNGAVQGNHAPFVKPIPPQQVVEGHLFELTVDATDPDEGQHLRFELIEHPPGMQIDPDTGVVRWIPSEQDGPGTYQIKIWVWDDGLPPRSTSVSFELRVLEENSAPVIEPIPRFVIPEGELWVYPIKVTDPDVPANSLRFEFTTPVPQGLELDPATQTLRWRPSEDQGPGVYTIGLRVIDNGVPELSTEITFEIEVLEVDNPPVISPIPMRTVPEGVRLTFQVEAYDPDGEAPLKFELVGGVPAGAWIEPNSGVFTWQPNEEQGPGVYEFTVRVTELSQSSLFSEARFTVEVLEENSPPEINFPGRVEVREGELFVLEGVVEDRDVPQQQITLKFLQPPPQGLRFDSSRRALIWDVPYELEAGDIVIECEATDNGSPPLSAYGMLRISIVPQSMLRISEIQYHPDAASGPFIEIINASTRRSEDLSNARVGASGCWYVFPANVRLEPGQAVVVAADPSRFLRAYTQIDRSFVFGPWVGRLDPSGEFIELSKVIDGRRVVVDRVRFEGYAPWPLPEPRSSLQRIDLLRDGRVPANWLVVPSTNQQQVIFSYTNVWTYQDNGETPPVNWTAVEFDDSNWPKGPGLLYHEEAELPAPKGTELRLGPTSFYFRSAFDYFGPLDGVKLVLYTIVDDGCIVYLNGKEILRVGMPDGPVGPDTLASRTVGDAAIEGPFEISQPPLIWGRNVLAVEVHQHSSTSSDVVLGLQLAVDFSLLPTSTPGHANVFQTRLPRFPNVWLNELQLSNDGIIRDAKGEAEPWVEIVNLDVLGWPSETFGLSVGSGGTWWLPSGMLQPFSYSIVWLDGEAEENTSGEMHSSIKPSQLDSVLMLEWREGCFSYLLDTIRLVSGPPGTSYGYRVDGARSERLILQQPTPAQANGVVTFQPVIKAVGLAEDGILRLVIGTTAGERYRLLSTDKLPDGNWRVDADIYAEAAELVVEIPMGVDAARFYRVSWVP